MHDNNHGLIKTPCRIAAIALALLLAGCESSDAPSTDIPVNPQTAFFERLTDLCGKAFAGQLVSNDKADTDMAGQAMTMHVAECSDSEIKIPFHIETRPGTWDRSRTWIISRVEGAGLRLKHDHRHDDGTSDKVTMYGGDTVDSGSATRQQFPVDAESIALFNETGLTASVTNIWAVEVDDSNYTYELSRENRLFRVTFDLTEAVEKPPLPWGWQ